MPSETLDYEKILNVLASHEVDFVLVGGLCAVLHGAPIHTYDVDIVPSRESINLERLVSALAEIDTYYREHPRTKLRPVAARMAGHEHHLLTSSAGDLDVLGVIARNRDYTALLPDTVELKLDANTSVRLLDLRTLIITKRETGREKDKLVLPILMRTLEEAERLAKVPEQDAS